MSGFARHRRSRRVIANFTGFEADLLRSLASQLVELLRNEAAVPRDDRDSFEAMMDFSGPTTEPDDPVLARLFPTAYPDDDEDGLMIDVELDEPEAECWLRSFTDLRLALATRLGVEEGDEAVWFAMPDDDPRAQAHDIYEWVGYLQETLVEALTDG
jgi:hypothetical protein